MDLWERFGESLYYTASIMHAYETAGNKKFKAKHTPANIGGAITASFVVDLRSAIIEAAKEMTGKVTLPHVGDFNIHEGHLTFTPSDELDDDFKQASPVESKLLKFVAQFGGLINLDIITHEKLEIHQCLVEPIEIFLSYQQFIPGQEYLRQVFGIFAKSRWANDRALKESIKCFCESAEVRKKAADALFEIACLAMHDAIRYGGSFYLETIGKFYQDLSFCADIEIQRSLSIAYRHRNTSSVRAQSSLRWIK